jgi:phage replication O-like protein O
MTSFAIVAPNYTQVPNVIFDYWMPVISSGAFKVLICMCRKIFGWHKSSDSISKNQLMKVTGLSKNSIQTALEELERHGLILKIQRKNEYGHQPNTYALNVDKPQDRFYQDPNLPGDWKNFKGGGSRNDLGVGQVLTEEVGQILTPQKKDYTKERVTKERGGEASVSPSPTSFDKLKRSYGELGNVQLEDDEHEKLIVKLGAEVTANMIKRLDLYIGQTGKYYNSHYATLLRWFEDDSAKSTGLPVAKHRQGSKLAFETEKDTWKPPLHEPLERTLEEKAKVKKEFGVDL